MDDEQQARIWRRQAAEGDREAATRLLHAYYERVYAYLRRLSGNDADAADLTQDTFRRVWTSLDLYREEARVTTWIHRIAYCAWVDWMRQRKPDSARDEAWWASLPDAHPTPNERAERHDAARELWSLVNDLPEEEAQAIHLRYGQRLSLKDTSETLNRPLSTLKNRIRSGLDRLKSRLNPSLRGSQAAPPLTEQL